MVFPVLWLTIRPLSYPERAGIPITRKGLTLLPRIVRRPQHLPLGRQLRSPERNVPRTSFCRYNDMPDSSRLGKPPSRTLLLRYVSCRTDPFLSELSTTDYSHVLLNDLYHNPTQQKYTINTLNSNNSRNYINPRNTLVYLNKNKIRLLSSRIHAELTDSPCHRKRPPPVRR